MHTIFDSRMRTGHALSEVTSSRQMRCWLETLQEAVDAALVHTPQQLSIAKHILEGRPVMTLALCDLAEASSITGMLAAFIAHVLHVCSAVRTSNSGATSILTFHLTGSHAQQ